jgi:hypothetical protein
MGGGFVMATGIVSIAIRLDGHVTLSRALLVLTAVGWVSLGAASRAWRRSGVLSLTAVAGTAVLGTRLTLLGWSWAGAALLAMSTALCLALMRLLMDDRGLPASGTAFLVVVAPQSLAVLAASLAVRLVSPALAWGALLPFAAGLGGYTRVLARFDRAELRTGAGDHWVAGGAIAISTLACADLSLATAGGLHAALRAASLVLWALTMAWLPALIGGEAVSARRRYDVRRWATVFPLGMYSVMSFAVGAVAGSAWILDFARAWTWVALAAWIATAIGAARLAVNHIVLRYRER